LKMGQESTKRQRKREATPRLHDSAGVHSLTTDVQTARCTPASPAGARMEVGH